MAFLSLADFWQRLHIERSSCELESRSNFNETEGGDVTIVQRGARMWEGQVFVAGNNDQQSGLSTVLMAKVTSGAYPFLVEAVNRVGPQNNRSGSLFLNKTFPITAISADREVVNLSGFPASFTLKAGDFFYVTYGAQNRVTMHQVAADRASFSTGILSNLAIFPPLPRVVNVNAPAVFHRPRCFARVIPGSYSPPMEGVRQISGFSFKWRQTFK